MFTFTAVVSILGKEVQRKSGDDLDSLLAWMISQAQEEEVRYTGYVIDNKTKKIVKRFRTCSIN